MFKNINVLGSSVLVFESSSDRCTFLDYSFNSVKGIYITNNLTGEVIAIINGQVDFDINDFESFVKRVEL